MAELGIDISRQESKTFDRYPGQPFDAVITVCDQANEACPVFRGAARRLHWRFPDPSKATGTEEEQLALLVEGPEDNGHLAECTGSGAGHGSRRAASRSRLSAGASDSLIRQRSSRCGHQGSRNGNFGMSSRSHTNGTPASPLPQKTIVSCGRV
jgi:hypothetical protein